MRSKFVIAVVACLFCSFLQASEDVVENNKTLVVDFYEQVIFGGNRTVIDQYIGEQYIQHNPHVADGKDGFLTFFDSLPARDKAHPWGEIVRVIAEDDLVVLHIRWNAWSEKPWGAAGIDIFRVKEGKLVEHWDVLQDVPEKLAHENTMF